ncbi:UDP-N-acetylmuramoyl-L-alanyl-D-glutamate--2,6-diaminopimelate ligase [Actinomycetes bacterium]|nr:UDP-N-acetylmuramoyl-L-alanyl-D-glutamate--2,6-diaminopimelate ligase [Actinomycetes bacterium]
MIRPLTQSQRSLASIASTINAKSDLSVSDLEKIAVTGIASSSSDVEPGDLFCAFAGAKVHGATFAKDAIKSGAVAILTDTDGAKLIKGLPVLVVTEPRKRAAILTSWFYGEPMRDLFSIGITGTNGKTTVSTLCHQIFQSAGQETGLIGTVETRIGNEVLTSTRTTPEAAELQALVATMRERHCRNLVMEVSSHAIALERIRGSYFAAVGFTNLSQDHLDFHASMEDYFETKSKLFRYEYADQAFINIDDSYGQILAEKTELPVQSLSRFNENATWHYTRIEEGIAHSDISIRGVGGVLIDSRTTLRGGFNFDNLLMAVAICVESGIDPMDIQTLIPHLVGAVGRLEPVNLGQNFTALVDYAHSPDAVARVLAAAREMTDKRVIGVLGCGGDRDNSKRSIMGQELSLRSDVAIYTSDNPRSENPQAILEQMTQGLKISEPSAIVQDRAEAIKLAVNLAQPGDVVIVLGKGHERGQEIAGVVHPFDDRLVLAHAIEAKK